jgi:putative zinc finger protein
MGCPITVSIGAYLLDAVDPAEREQISDHLRWCELCDLAPLPGILHHVFAGRRRQAAPAVARDDDPESRD